jgi:hypothetical protein
MSKSMNISSHERVVKKSNFKKRGKKTLESRVFFKLQYT